jgi:hypothetical protein
MLRRVSSHAALPLDPVDKERLEDETGLTATVCHTCRQNSSQALPALHAPRRPRGHFIPLNLDGFAMPDSRAPL